MLPADDLVKGFDIVERNLDAHVLYRDKLMPLKAAEVPIPDPPTPRPPQLDEEAFRQWRKRARRRREGELKETAFAALIAHQEIQHREFRKR